MASLKKEIFVKLLPEKSQPVENKIQLANKINNIFLKPQLAYKSLD